MFERLDAAARLLWGRGFTAALIVLTMWLPGNLLLNYLTLSLGREETSARLLVVALAYDLLAAPLVVGALYVLLRASLYGGKTGYRGAMSVAVARYGLLFANRLIVQILVGAGLLLFIVPGLILMSRWALADAAVVFEAAVPSQARARSVSLTEGSRAEILLAWQLPVMAIWGLSWWVGIRFGGSLDASWWVAALADCVWDLLLAFPVALLFIYYAQARVREMAIAGRAAALEESP